MVANRLVITLLAFLYSTIIAVDAGAIQLPNTTIQAMVSFNNKFRASINTSVIFFNEQSIHNNTMAFAGCNNYHEKKVLDCAVHVVVPTSDLTTNDVKCDTKYYPDEGKNVARILILRPLSSNRVLFKWLVTDEKDPDSDSYVVIRVINMKDCTHKDTGIPLGEKPYFHRPVLVFYNDTYDVFSRNKDVCGDFMCGRTYDNNGKLINGPVASYLPAEVFQKPTFVCPIQQGSSALGHFILSAKLRLISSASGKVKDLMDLPPTIAYFAYSCDYGFLGVCWVEEVGEEQLRCRQYDSQGQQVMTTLLKFPCALGSAMSVKNLRNGGLLLQTTTCKDDTGCDDDPRDLIFSVQKIGTAGNPTPIFGTNEMYCSSSLETAVNEMPNSDVCITVGCLSNTNIPPANSNTRAYIYCFGRRNMKARYDVPDSLKKMLDEQENPKQSSKPDKPRKPPIWRV